MKRSLIFTVAVLILFGSITLTKTRITEIRGTEPKPQSMAYLPGSEKVRPLLLGYHNTYAHYLWIRTVIYFGSNLITGQRFPWLIQMIDIITRLHPHFYPAYEFAGHLVPAYSDNPDAARVILERGMIHLGDTRWNIPFILGMHYYRYHDDYETAARFFSIASGIPGAPSERLGTLAATFFHRSGRDSEGLELLYFLYETSENPSVRQHLLKKIEELLEQKYSYK